MEDFKLRLITEQEELDNKLNKLLSFLESAKFITIPPNHQVLLIEQVKAMSEYNNILKERIYLLTDYRKELVQSFLKDCTFGFSKGQVYFSSTMDKFTLFFNENGVDFFELWNGYNDVEKDKMLQECFIVR